MISGEVTIEYIHAVRKTGHTPALNRAQMALAKLGCMSLEELEAFMTKIYYSEKII